MQGIYRFEDLLAWKLAFELKLLADAYCEKPIIQKDFKFRAQLLDAAASAPRPGRRIWPQVSHRVRAFRLHCEGI